MSRNVEKTSEAAFHMKGIMKPFAVLCLDLIIRISVMIIFFQGGRSYWTLLFVVLTVCLVNENFLCFLPQVLHVIFTLRYYRFPLVTTKAFY